VPSLELSVCLWVAIFRTVSERSTVKPQATRGDTLAILAHG